MSVAYLYPNTDDGLNQWTKPIGDTYHYESIDDPQDTPDDAAYLREGTTDEISRHGVTDWALPENNVIDSVEVYYRAKQSGTAVKIAAGVYYNSTYTWASDRTLTSSYTTYSDSLACPSGAWNDCTFNDLRVAIKARDCESLKYVYCSQLYIKITYSVYANPTVRQSHLVDLDKKEIKTMAHRAALACFRNIELSNIAAMDKRCQLRLAQRATAQTGWDKSLAGGVFFETYTAPEWDADYYKRKEISFGTNHDTLPSGYTVSVEHMTGYEEKIPGGDNCVPNEGCHVILYYNGYFYISWLAKNFPGDVYRVYMTRRNKETGIYDTAVEVITSGTAYDSHYSTTPFIDSDGYIHLLYGCHHTPIKYLRSTNPGDITSWETMDDLEYEVGAYAAGFTYPHMVEDSSGNLYAFARVTNNHPWSNSAEEWGYFKSTNGGDTWGSLKIVVSYIDNYWGGSSVYAGCIYINGKFHVTVNWHENYLAPDQRNRACSYIWSTNAVDWYALPNVYVGSVYTWYPGGENPDEINYSTVPKLALTTDTNWPEPPEWPPPDGVIYVVRSYNQDASGNHYLSLDKSSDIANCHIELGFIFCKWNSGTSTWDRTDVTASLPKMAHDRVGGGLVRDGNTFYIFAFVLPESTEERFGLELYRYVGASLGTSWTGNYMTKNTAFGAPLMWTLNPALYSESSGVHTVMAYGRCNVGYVRFDNQYPYALMDGDDLRVVRTDLVNGSYQHTEINRLPDRFGAEDTLLDFATLERISANCEHPSAHSRYWLIYNEPYESGEAANDHHYVYPFYDGFEVPDSCTSLSATADWDGDSEFKVYAAYDWTEWSSSHTNKLWDGDKFAVLHSYTGAKNIRTPFTLNNHTVRIMMWLEQAADYGYVELYNSGDGKYIRIGMSVTPKYCYMKSGGSWTEVANPAKEDGKIITGQYYECIFTITSSGVTATIGGTSLLTNDTHMTSATHFGLGATATGGKWCWDALYIKHYVANPPEMTLGAEEGEDNWGIKRLANQVALLFFREKRISQKAALAKFGQIKLSNKAFTEKYYRHKISQLSALDRNAALKISHILGLDQIAIEKLANIITSDKNDIEILANISALAKFDEARLSQLAKLELVATERLAHKLTVEKYALIRLSNTASPEAAELISLAQRVGLDKADRVHLANAIQGVKFETVRLGHAMATNKFSTLKIAGITAGDKKEFIELAQTIAGDKDALTKQAHETDLNKAEIKRVAHIVSTDRELKIRAANILGLDKRAIVSIANKMGGDKYTIQMLANLLAAEKNDIIRLSNKAELSFLRTLHIAHELLLNRIAEIRLAHFASFEGMAQIRMSHIMDTEKRYQIMLSQKIGVDKVSIIALANAIAKDKVFAARVAHAANIAKSDLIKIAQTVQTDKRAVKYLDNLLSGYKYEIIKLAQKAHVDKTEKIALAHKLQMTKDGEKRISNIIASYKNAVLKMSQICDVRKQGIIRLSNLIATEKISALLLAHKLGMEKQYTARLAQIAGMSGENIIALAHKIQSDKYAQIRMANDSEMNKITALYISGIAGLDKLNAKKLSQWADLTKTDSARLNHILALNKFSRSQLANYAALLVRAFAGMELAEQAIANMSFDDPQIDNMALTAAAIKNMSLTDATVKNMSLTDVTIKCLEFDDLN